MITAPDRQTFRTTLAQIAEKAKAVLPSDVNGRLEGAVKLVLLDEVQAEDDGTIIVGSCTDPLKTYRLVGASCECKDFTDGKAPEGWCRHRIAAGLHKRVRELLAAPSPASPPAPALPEAPASCNVYVQIGGHKVQVTLRDADEQRMLERLQILLDRYPAAPERGRETQVAAAMETPVCKYHGTMKASTKAPGTYYCASRMGDGSYCKERYPQA